MSQHIAMLPVLSISSVSDELRLSHQKIKEANQRCLDLTSQIMAHALWVQNNSMNSKELADQVSILKSMDAILSEWRSNIKQMVEVSQALLNGLISKSNVSAELGNQPERRRPGRPRKADSRPSKQINQGLPSQNTAIGSFNPSMHRPFSAHEDRNHLL